MEGNLMSKRSNLKKLHKDNRGSGLIMVLIMVAFLSILTAILMFTTYIGYQMRLVDKQGKDNFYTAETVLDEINVGLQTEVSNALSKAYSQVMLNYSLYETSAERTQKLYEIYYAQLQLALQQDSMNTTRYNIDKLRGYVSGELYGDGKEGVAADGSRDNFGNYGAIVETNNSSGICAMSLEPNGIILKDLKVTYVNQRGFVSIISTDIRIALPSVDFSQSTAIPDLNKYCLVADQGLIAGNTVNTGSVVITGDVYADSMKFGSQIGTDFAGNAYTFVGGTDMIFNAPAVTPGSTDIPTSLVVSKNAVEMTNTTLTTSSVDFWSQEIVLDSTEVNLDGNTYVQDDLRLEGTGSEVTLSGTYTGFGTSLELADGSSSIVVNGRDSSLDLSALESLNIGGHTFVATSSQALVSNVHDENDRQTDILMGESVAVKSNQLIYLIPPEALGCEIQEDGTIGESVYRSNPMKLTQYQEIKNNSQKYVMIDANRQIDALGGHTLSEYMNQQELAGGGSAYRPIVVVKQTNAGPIVYCYMQFKDQEAANLYFRHYYGVNAEVVEKYTKIYADAIKMPENSTDLVYLHLAGNVLAYEGEDYELIDATDSVRQTKRAGQLAAVRSDMFTALTTKMVTNIAQVTVEEQGRTVFYNIIDDNALSAMVGLLKASATDDTIVVHTADGSMATLLSTSDVMLDNNPAYTDVHLVVSLQDVHVKRDFQGTIIAGGEIIIDDESDYDKKVEITSLSVEEFTQLLQAKQEKDGTEYFVYDVFLDGKSFAGTTTTSTSYGTQEVDLAELIIYERWSKQ